jgi:tyrosine-protein kinase Etk/Wzc
MLEKYLNAITDVRSGASARREVNLNLLFEALRYWYWLLFSLLSCLLAAFIFLRYSTPEFKITASVLIRDDSRGTDFGDAALIESLGLSAVKSSVDNEVQLLKSRTLMEQVVKHLQLNIHYYAVGKLKTTEIYDKSPFRLRLLDPKYAGQKPITYQLTANVDRYQLTFDSKTLYGRFGDTMLLPQGPAILKKTAYQPAIEDKYIITISIPLEPVDQCISALKVSATNKLASIVDLEINETIPVKGEAILNQLLTNYLSASIDDKNRIADSTLSFIEENLKVVSQELSNIEHEIEVFRKANKITDLEENARLLIQNASKSNHDERGFRIQLQIAESLLNYLTDTPDHIIPSSLHVNDPQFTALVLKYNEMQLAKEKTLLATTTSHPIIETLEVQLNILRSDLIALIQSQKRELQVSIAAIEQYNLEYALQIDQIPGKQRIFLDYARQREIKQELYLFLLKKKVETSISRSSTLPNARIIDPPKSAPVPIEPNQQLVLLISGFLGLGIPFATLHLKNILTTTINSKTEFLQNCNVPVLAEIGHQVLGSSQQNHVIREQFRVLRTHIQFLSTNTGSKTILLTSGRGGEGKSFIAVNLADSFALAGKKVILLELDLRKPKLAESMHLHSKGFTNYLISDEHIVEFIQKSGNKHSFDILTAGPSPPNPAEMLAFPKVGEMMSYLKENYNFIIIDTPPVGLVTDARLLSYQVDLSFYIVRLRFSQKHQIEDIQEIHDRKQFPGFYAVMNDVRTAAGYGYYEQKPTFWQLLKHKFKMDSQR